MTDFFCKKCKKPTALVNHRYCTSCGEPYDYKIFELQTVPEDHPVYTGIMILHEQFSDYAKSPETTKYKYFNELFSQGSIKIIFIFRDLLMTQLAMDFKNNTQAQKLINAKAEGIANLYFNLIVDGYLAWVAQNKISGKNLFSVHAPYSDTYVDEWDSNKKIIYDDHITVLAKSGKNKSVSFTMSRIFVTIYLFKGREYFDALEELKTIEQLYGQIQYNFAEAVIGGYALAVTDSKYRK